METTARCLWPDFRQQSGLSRPQIGSDQWTGLDIHVVGAANCLARPRRVELQAILVEQVLMRRTAAEMQRPNAPRQRIGEAGTDAAVEGASLRDRQQDVSELIGARARG